MIHSMRRTWALRYCARILTFTSGATLGFVPPLAAQTRAPATPTATAAEPNPVTETRRGTTLPDLLAYSEQHAPALRVAIKRQGYAAAARAGAEPLLRQNPTLEFAIGPRFNGAVSHDFDFIAAVSQPVEIAGERGARLDAATRLGARLEAEVGVTRWQLRREVVSAYYSALVANEQALVAEQVEQFSKQLLEIVRRRLTAGEATAIEVRVAELDVVQSKRAVMAAKQTHLQSRLRLAEVTGWPVESPPEVSGSLATPSAVPPASVVLAAVEHNPSLNARRAAVAEAQARKELAEREGTLTPIVGVQVAREGAAGSPANYIVLGTVGVPLPFWQRNQEQRAQARVDEEVAVVEQRAFHEVTRARVMQAHAEVTGAYQRLMLFNDEVAPRLEESLTLLQRGFDAGELPILDVMVARERFLTARSNALTAYADYYRAVADLEFVAGADSNTFGTGETAR